MEERKQYIQQIIQALKTKNEIAYIEGAFRHYIDNQISDQELDFILKDNNEVLPDEFFDLSVREKKMYYTGVWSFFLQLLWESLCLQSLI